MAKTSDMTQGMKQVLWLELAWSIFSVAVAFSCGTMMVRVLTGTSNGEIIQNAAFNLKICTLLYRGGLYRTSDMGNVCRVFSYRLYGDKEKENDE